MESSGRIRQRHVGRITYQIGRRGKDGVDNSSRQGPSAAQATKATGGAGEEGTNGWTTNESPENEKRGEGRDKRVNRTKDGGATKARMVRSARADHTARSMHTIVSYCGEGGGEKLDLEKERKGLVYRCAGLPHSGPRHMNCHTSPLTSGMRGGERGVEPSGKLVGALPRTAAQWTLGI